MALNTIVVIGGGAAGFFAAIHAALYHQQTKVILLEKTNQLLSKVRISGGGRCNVTHSCFDPNDLVKNYPRGSKELLGPFFRFQPKDTMSWFEERGVKLKTEDDGRIFPVSDSSQTIIDALRAEGIKCGVEIRLQSHIEGIKKEGETFTITFTNGDPLVCERLILASGSSHQGFEIAKEFGHTIVSPVPSLFTFNVPTSPLKELSGISVPNARVKIKGTNLEQAGPLLITHFGFSGPAILKLSAWGARILHEMQYKAEIEINWAAGQNVEQILLEQKRLYPTRLLHAQPLFGFSRSLWRYFTANYDKRFNDLSHKEIGVITSNITSDTHTIDGKTTNKEEFVTAGGVNLKEVNFKTLESKITPGLYFAGEILDIDGVTGGFNFQNAWTTGFLAGTSIQ